MQPQPLLLELEWWCYRT